jgi:hypothetical protein
MYSSYSIQNTRHKTLIISTRRDATAERGARFHPTVGSVTPNGFTTSHPRARPRCFEIQSPTSSSTEVKDEGYSPSPDTEK